MRRVPLVALVAAFVFVVAPSAVTAPLPPGPAVVVAKDAVAEVKCARKIGKFKNQRTRLGVGEDSLQCFYDPPRGMKNAGDVRVAVNWNVDVPGERSRCVTRSGQNVDNTLGGPEDFNRELYSLERNVRAKYWHDRGKAVSRSQAEKAARRLLTATEPLAHPCLPNEDAAKESAAASEAAAAAIEPLPPACPLIIGDKLVRIDWYDGDPPFAFRNLRCVYQPAYRDEGDATQMDVSWIEGDAADAAFWACNAE